MSHRTTSQSPQPNSLPDFDLPQAHGPPTLSEFVADCRIEIFFKDTIVRMPEL